MALFKIFASAWHDSSHHGGSTPATTGKGATIHHDATVDTPIEKAFSEDIAVRIDDEDVPDDETGQVALDILEMDTAIVVVAPMAGILLDDIDITVSRNILTLSGIRKKPSIYNNANQVLVEECFFGAFSRSIILPENLALNKIRATIENNLLIIDIPKLQFPSKSIKIDRLER